MKREVGAENEGHSEVVKKIFLSMSSDVLAEFVCPITLRLPTDPVVAFDGNVYERDAISQWLDSRQTSPMTNMEMPKLLVRVRSIRNVLVNMLLSGNKDERLMEWARTCWKIKLQRMEREIGKEATREKLERYMINHFRSCLQSKRHRSCPLCQKMMLRVYHLRNAGLI